MNQERLLKVILSVRTTEKTTRIQQQRQYVFKVINDATKTEIKTAAKQLFSVEVESVGIVNVKAKKRRVAAIIGSRQKWKKAYVVLKEGYSIKVITEASAASAIAPPASGQGELPKTKD